MITALYLSREAFRRACLRTKEQKSQSLSKITNIAWLTVPYGLLICFLSYYGFVMYAQYDEKYSKQEHFKSALILYGKLG